MPLQTNDESVTKETVARIDERTKSIQSELVQIRIDLKDSVDRMTDTVKDIDRRQTARIDENEKKLENTIEDVNKSITDLKDDTFDTYVTKDEFALVKRVVYGFVGLVVTAVVVALLTSVINQSKAYVSPSQQFSIPIK